jgi:drug/metabolite transporter (DMT)-like permease
MTRDGKSEVQHVLQVAIIVSAGLAVAVGDVLIKKVGTTTVSFSDALVHPLMAGALCLYAIQIVLFAYVFVRRWDLGIVALLQMAFYAAACVLIGRFLFGEQIRWLQGLGMLLTLCGVVLMNSC